MKRYPVILCVVIFLGGCVSADIAPPRERVASFNRAYVVAMEPRPLGVPTGLRSQIPVQAAGGSISTIRGIGVFNTIAMFLEIPEASRRTDEASKSIQALLEASGAWSPTTVLANEVARQLMANGIASSVAPEVKALRGVDDRSATLTMENWLGPIRAHYNDSGPVHDYRELAATPSILVLEVSISNYEITDGLLLQVHLKMIDPSNGKVIGRARAGNPGSTPGLTPLDQAFANNAIKFKGAFTQTGRQLIAECLANLGLLRAKE